MDENYVQGFADKCAEIGADPEALVKSAILPAWGGQSRYIGPESGLGLDVGYTYGVGAFPIPHVSARLGNDRGGVGLGASIMGPIVGLDTGRVPGQGLEASRPRSLWKLLGDRVREVRASRVRD